MQQSADDIEIVAPSAKELQDLELLAARFPLVRAAKPSMLGLASQASAWPS